MSDALTQALLSSRYQAKENPFGIAAQSLALNAGRIVNPYGSTGSNAAASIGAALLAGLMGGVARYQTDNDNAELAPVAQRLLTTQDPTEQAQIVQEHPRLAGLVAALSAEQNQRAAELAQKRQELELGRENDVAKFEALAPLQRQAKLEEEKALQPIKVSTASQTAQAEASARARVEDTRNRGNTEIDKTVDALRKEFQGKKEVDDFRVVERTAKAMANTLKDKGAATDLELTRYSILLLEPGMAVREGEQAAVLKSAAIPDQWKAQISKALSGTSALDDEVREGLKRLAGRAYNETAAQYERQRQFYTGEAKGRGLDPSRVDVIGAAPGVQELFPGVALQGAQGPSAQPTPGSSPTAQQLQAAGYVKVPGGWQKPK